MTPTSKLAITPCVVAPQFPSHASVTPRRRMVPSAAPVHEQCAHATERNQDDNELRRASNSSCHGSAAIPKLAALMARTNLITRLTWTKLRHHYQYHADVKQCLLCFNQRISTTVNIIFIAATIFKAAPWLLTNFPPSYQVVCYKQISYLKLKTQHGNMGWCSRPIFEKRWYK